LSDWLEHDRNTIFFWHPGMAPMDMCNPVGGEGGPTLARHFNIVKPMVVDGSLRINEDVTITRLWRCDGRYHMTAFEGRSVAPRRTASLWRGARVWNHSWRRNTFLLGTSPLAEYEIFTEGRMKEQMR
jgi:hypothetical protein